MALLASLNFKTIRLGSCLYDQWLKEKSLFDEQLNAARQDDGGELTSEVSAGDFLDHLLDLHRRICRVCRWAPPSCPLLSPHSDFPAQQHLEFRSSVTGQSPVLRHPAHHPIDIRSPTSQHSPQSHSSRHGDFPLSNGEGSATESHVAVGETLSVAHTGTCSEADRMDTSPLPYIVDDSNVNPDDTVKSELAWDQEETTKEKSCQTVQHNYRAPSPVTDISPTASSSVNRSSDPQDSILGLQLTSSPIAPKSGSNRDHSKKRRSGVSTQLGNRESLACCLCGQRLADVASFQQHCIHGNCRQQRDLLSLCHDNSTGRPDCLEEDTTLGVGSEPELHGDHPDPSEQWTSGGGGSLADRFTCNSCGKAFTHKSSLNIHLTMHKPSESHTCEVCNQTFAQKDNLTQHRLVHAASEKLSCLVCRKKFKYRNSLYVHVLTEHGDTEYGSGIQTLCMREQLVLSNATTSRTSHLTLGEHARMQPAQSSVGSAYSETFSETRHLRRQSGSQDREMPFAQEARPLEPSFWREERRLAFGKKSRQRQQQHHECDICNKVFSQSNNLKRHRRIHTKEKPYKCDVCLRGFAQSNTLKEHRHIHSNHKQYSCSACGKRFRQRSSVDKHRKINSTHGIVDCPLCGQKFTHKCTLRLHMANHVVF